MYSPKEGDVNEPPLALSGRTGEEGQNEMLSGNDEEYEGEEYDDYQDDDEGPLTPLSHQIEEDGEEENK